MKTEVRNIELLMNINKDIDGIFLDKNIYINLKNKVDNNMYETVYTIEKTLKGKKYVELIYEKDFNTNTIIKDTGIETYNIVYTEKGKVINIEKIFFNLIKKKDKHIIISLYSAKVLSIRLFNDTSALVENDYKDMQIESAFLNNIINDNIKHFTDEKSLTFIENLKVSEKYELKYNKYTTLHMCILKIKFLEKIFATQSLLTEDLLKTLEATMVLVDQNKNIQKQIEGFKLNFIDMLILNSIGFILFANNHFDKSSLKTFLTYFLISKDRDQIRKSFLSGTFQIEMFLDTSITDIEEMEEFIDKFINNKKDIIELENEETIEAWNKFDILFKNTKNMIEENNFSIYNKDLAFSLLEYQPVLALALLTEEKELKEFTNLTFTEIIKNKRNLFTDTVYKTKYNESYINWYRVIKKFDKELLKDCYKIEFNNSSVIPEWYKDEKPTKKEFKTILRALGFINLLDKQMNPVYKTISINNYFNHIYKIYHTYKKQNKESNIRLYDMLNILIKNYIIDFNIESKNKTIVLKDFNVISIYYSGYSTKKRYQTFFGYLKQFEPFTDKKNNFQLIVEDNIFYNLDKTLLTVNNINTIVPKKIEKILKQNFLNLNNIKFSKKDEEISKKISKSYNQELLIKTLLNTNSNLTNILPFLNDNFIMTYNQNCKEIYFIHNNEIIFTI